MNNEPTLEEYLYNNPFNINVYESLEQNEGLFEPLEFFNILYGEFDFFEKNQENYLLIKNSFKEIILEGAQLYFFLFFLVELIKHSHHSGNGDYYNFSPGGFKSYEYIKKLFDDVASQMPPNNDSGPEHIDSSDSSNHSNENNSIQLSTYTNSQLVLIFYYFLENNGFTLRNNINIAPVAKFIHLITGKKFSATTNSEFYKKLQKAPNFKSDKELIKDLELIKPLFQSVQLNDIIKLIDLEIETAKRENRKAP